MAAQGIIGTMEEVGAEADLDADHAVDTSDSTPVVMRRRARRRRRPVSTKARWGSWAAK